LRAGLVALALLVAACGGAEGSTIDPLVAEGRDVYGRLCSTCHGGGGAGGVGPGFSGVLETFPACADQVRWIALGSAGWLEEVGPTYGEQDKEVRGGMPGFGDSLTPDQIEAVATFVRVRYGGGEESTTVAGCVGG